MNTQHAAYTYPNTYPHNVKKRLKLYIQSLRLILCGCSMVLTALFIIHVSGFSFSESINVIELFSLILCLLVGFAIDCCKYVFWVSPKLSANIISLFLVLLSWLASLSFFLVQEDHKAELQRTSSPAYQAYLIQLQDLHDSIELKKKLSQQHMNSQYHHQWQKADDLQQDITALNQQKQRLMRNEHQIGVLGEHEKTGFYGRLSNRTGISTDVLKLVLYGTLSFIIEVCAIWILALKPWQEDNKQTPTTEKQHQEKPQQDEKKHYQNDQSTDLLSKNTEETLSNPIPKTEHEKFHLDLKQKNLDTPLADKILSDLQNGKIPIKLQHIAQQYELSESLAKKYLQCLIESQLVIRHHGQLQMNPLLLRNRPTS